MIKNLSVKCSYIGYGDFCRGEQIVEDGETPSHGSYFNGYRIKWDPIKNISFLFKFNQTWFFC